MGLVWTDTSYNGGTAIIDYSLSYRIVQEVGQITYSLIASGLTTKVYKVFDLIPGTFYEFVI